MDPVASGRRSAIGWPAAESLGRERRLPNASYRSCERLVGRRGRGALRRPPVREVLRVGTYKGIPGQFKSIQAAVNAAKPGDWILVGPGDYKSTSDRRDPGAQLERLPGRRADHEAGRLPARHEPQHGRSSTAPSRARRQCSRKTSAQNFGPRASSGKPLGLNGIMVWKAANVWVQNLTACNFLGGAGDAGNEVWWNGGDGSGKVGGHGYLGSYLNATSTYFDPANRGDGGHRTGSSRATGTAARGIRPTPATSTTRATTSAPASRVQPDRQPRAGASSARSATRARTRAAR